MWRFEISRAHTRQIAVSLVIREKNNKIRLHLFTYGASDETLRCRISAGSLHPHEGE